MNQEQQIIEQFKQAVLHNNTEAATQYLQAHPFLVAGINEPWFSFDTPAIVAAAAAGNREMVDVLLANGADLHARSSWWAGAFGVLHHDHAELSRYLIERGAPVDIHAAAALGMLDTISTMVGQDPDVVNQRGPDGQVPLHFAVQPEIIDYLLAHGAIIDMRDIDHGSTPAQWAVDNPAKCNYLLERGAAADILMAIKLGNTALVRSLIEAGPECLLAQVGHGRFTSGDSDGGHIYTYKIGANIRPLFLAATCGNTEIVELILAHSSIEQRFLLACMQADQAAVHELQEQYPNLVASLSAEDQSLIADAAWDNQIGAVQVMLEAGFDADARRDDGSFTALHNAAIRGNVEALQLLLSHGASTRLTNGYGGTALDSCAWGSVHMRNQTGNYAAVAETLIQAGASLPQSASGSSAVIEVLVRHGVPN
ncbi:ankyrin repeat domain-containing protein [Paenibacillus sp. CF384]|uniref:ankyrin repeat domain-containing protein n=1 Tax=Paenibacillus sp. CF384 TaxID=1884382 RepID=UPI000897BA5C|nr:ankyrin repeat domain-containing protein [Paenibacillus sp. CF384]SDX87092.1 Ankyrin repeat-containing protein [Paenibacillus sp. CF384]